jgi:hypothetical protein
MRSRHWLAAAAMGVATLGAWPSSKANAGDFAFTHLFDPPSQYQYTGDPLWAEFSGNVANREVVDAGGTVTYSVRFETDEGAYGAGQPVTGIRVDAHLVRLSPEGQVTTYDLLGSRTTDASGAVSFTFTGPNVNSDDFYEFSYDLDRDGDFDSGTGSWVSWRIPVVEVGAAVGLGSASTNVNLRGNGVVQFAILGSATFDVSTVDLSTVALAGAPVRRNGNGTIVSQSRDVNGDGYTDVVLGVNSRQMQLTSESTSAEITGNLTSAAGGTPIHGSGPVTVVGN